MTIHVKRVYEEPAEAEGYRVLADRLWPRGLPKDRARLDEWRRELAPSGDLRRWLGHDPDRRGELLARYRVELDGRREAAALCGHIEGHPTPCQER